MAIIRNPIIIGSGGVSWNIKTACSAPTEPGKEGDIILVFPEETIIPDIKNVKQVGINNNLVISDGNIYADDGVFIFSALDGTLGAERAHIINNRTIDLNTNISNAVVNVGGMQVECDVYVWDIDTQTWIQALYQELPLAFKEKETLLKWYLFDINKLNISTWSLLNLQENLQQYINENLYALNEDINIMNWYIPNNIPSVAVWRTLSLNDSGTITINNTPIPF